jgi:hypothetical protein
MGILHEDVSTFLTISLLIIYKIRNVLGKSCRENESTHFILGNFFPKIAPFMR